METLRIIIVDDHPLFGIGLKSLFDKQPHVDLVNVIDSFDALKTLCTTSKIDVILMDVEMGTNCGVEFTQQIKLLFPKTKVLAFTGHNNEKTIRQMMAAGASGYLTKNASIEELLQAIREVHKGHLFLATTVSETLLRSQNISPTKMDTVQSRLTDREFQIMEYIVKEELSNKEIAQRLYISPRTVETHKRNLIQKLKVRNTIGLAKYYFNKTPFQVA